MGIADTYHFHKDCKYYPECTEEIVTKGKQKFIQFTCPKLKYPQLYYKGDLHSIKWQCFSFEPLQLSLDDVFPNKEIINEQINSVK